MATEEERRHKAYTKKFGKKKPKKPLTSQQRLDKAYADKYGDKDKPKVKKDKAPSKKKASAKKTPTATKVAKKVVKATAKKAVVPPVSPNLFRTMIGFGSRVVAPVAAAVTGMSLAAPVFRHLFPESEPWKSTPELKASQKRMNKAIDKMGGKQTPQQQIRGGGYHTGLQPDKTKAVSPLVLTGPVTAAKTTTKDEKKESLLGKTKPRLFKDTEGIPNMDVDIVGTLSRYPGALDKTTKEPKSEVVKKATKPKAVKKTTESIKAATSIYPKISTTNKPLNEGSPSPKTPTDIEKNFLKLMQDSSRADRHLGAPKKKPLGMEGAFWDGASWVI